MNNCKEMWLLCLRQDFLYKLTGRTRTLPWSKSNPWKQKFFVLKRVGNKPVLEYFNKRPKNRNTVPRGKLSLWPSYRVEKVTNMKNRAYVFEITTPDAALCLSADEQRGMDVFVFFLQVQARLKDQIRDDFVVVWPENSEAQRRIGAKGTNCLLHVSPFGATLALQSSRTVLAQWPLKSIRFYESTGEGQFSLEAGRIAPMGDGHYMFHTEVGEDNTMYDLLDQYVLDTLGKIQPDRRGNPEEIEDYMMEAEKLLALTTVMACTVDNPDIPYILQNNWNFDLNRLPVKPRSVVHTRLVPASSTNSLDSHHSGAPPVPSRGNLDLPIRNSPLVSRPIVTNPRPVLPPTTSHRTPPHSTNQTTHYRPRLPSPTTSSPMNIPFGVKEQENYFIMDSSGPSPESPFSPSSGDWYPPPSFKDATRLKSQTSHTSAGSAYSPDSYLLPLGERLAATPESPRTNQNASSLSRDSYLTASSPMTKGNSPQSQNANSLSRDSYLTPSYVGKSQVSQHDNLNISQSLPPSYEVNNNVTDTENSRRKHNKGAIEFRHSDARFHRLRSISCEDVSDYLRTVVYEEKESSLSKSMNDLDAEDDDDLPPEPFPRLQTFSGSIELTDYNPENYYNIEGLKGKNYDNPGLGVVELRKRFSAKVRGRGTLRRSVSNPAFVRVNSKEKLHQIRVSSIVKQAGLMNNKLESQNRHSSKSLLNLLPDALKRRLSKEGHKRRSQGTSSNEPSGANSPHSSRANSNPGSPHGTLPRDSSQYVAETGFKGIVITQRTRSFRKAKSPEVGTDKRNDSRTEKDGSKAIEHKPPSGRSPSTSPKKSPRFHKRNEVHKRSSENLKTESGHAVNNNEAGLVASREEEDGTEAKLARHGYSSVKKMSKERPKTAPKPKPTVRKKEAGDQESEGPHVLQMTRAAGETSGVEIGQISHTTEV